MAVLKKPLHVVIGILLITIVFVVGVIYVAVEWGRGQQQQAAVPVVSAGATQFSGTLPQAAPVTYQTKAGTQTTMQSAYPGYVYLYAKLKTDQATVEKAVQANGGSIAASLPNAGLYMIKVAAGQEGAFLTAIFKESWASDGAPAFPLVRGTVAVADFFSGTNSPSNCWDDHGELTGRKAGRLGGSILNIDLEKDLPSTNNVDLAAKMTQIIEANANGFDRIVFSLSLQSPVSNFPIPEADKTAEYCEQCVAVQLEQKFYYEAYFQAMEALVKNNPAAADKAAFVIIAGNAGTNLDDELSDLKQRFPNAFARIKIVGGTDGPKITHDFNHLLDNSGHNMAYSQAKGVPVCNPDGSIVATCKGTSYAAPEVAAVLDYIWARNPTLTSAQLMDVFDTALGESGQDNVLPQEGCGTKQAFLDRAVEIAREKHKTGTYAITIKRIGTVYGGFDIEPSAINSLASCTSVCTVAYKAGTAITITVHDDPGIRFDGWSGDCSGTAKTCDLTMDKDKLAIMRFSKETVQPQTPSGGSVCTHNADCNGYAWRHCTPHDAGALCGSDGLCHCNLIQDGFWVNCPCPSGYICIGRYCGAEVGGDQFS